MFKKIAKLIQNPELKFVGGFITFVFILLILIFALSIIIDPRGLYGTNIFKPLTLTIRSEKLASLERQSPPPEVIIYGSSRVFKLNPAKVEKYTGLKAFNASVDYGRPEEQYAMTRYVTDKLQLRPKLLLIGYHLGEFNNDEIEQQTINSTELRPYLSITSAYYLKNLIRTFKDTVNLNYLVDIGRSLIFSQTGYPRSKTKFLDNGYRDFDPNFIEPAEKRLDIGRAARLFENMPELNPERKQYLEKLLALAKETNMQVIIFITPMPTLMVEQLALTTNYSQRKQEFMDYLKLLSEEYPLSYYDFSSPSLFSGYEDAFDDITHPTEKNLDLIVRKIFKK